MTSPRTEVREWWGADIVPRIRWRIEIDTMHSLCDSDAVPVGYGRAWRVSGKDASIFMPMPINVIARAIRELYWRVKNPTFGSRISEMDKQREIGRSQGWRAGFTARSAIDRVRRNELAGAIKCDMERDD